MQPLDWLGWALFSVLFIVGLVAKVWGIRLSGTTRRNTDAQTTKLALDQLDDSAAMQQAQLRAVTAALASDAPQQSDEELAELEASQPPKYAYLIKYLRSRQRARSLLPNLVDDLDAIQARRMALERKIAQQLKVKDGELERLRAELHRVSERLADVIKTIAASPRLHISDTPPPDPAEGDIWLSPAKVVPDA